VSRVPLPDESSPDPELVPILDRLGRSIAAIPNMYRALGNAPPLLDAWTGFAWTLRSKAGVDRGLRELGIMRVAQVCGADYVWRSHWRAALAGGITEAQLDALAHWPPSDGFTDVQLAALAVADQLTREADLGDRTWGELRRHLDEREAVELLLTFAWYACVARMANGLRVPVEDGDVDIRSVPR
jgi:alkylhydroperoxidase family enzyme